MLNKLSKPINKFMAGLVLVTITAAVSLAGCTAAAKGPTTSTRTVPVQRQNLDVTVSVDGKLNMPQAFDLHFGAPGNVLDVNVKEGDVVKAGTVLATLDATTQELAIKTANNAVQTTLASLYETVPRLPQFPARRYLMVTVDPSDPSKLIYWYDPSVHDNPVYTSYYPTGTILDGYAWYWEEINTSQQLFLSENYTGVSSELNVALADLESITMMIEDAINNPESGLGNMAPAVANDDNVTYLEIMGEDPAGAAFYIRALRKDVDQIKQAQVDIQKARDLLTEKKYDEASAKYQVVLEGIAPLGHIVYTNYNILKIPDDTTVYGKDLSVRFFNAAEAKLNEAAAGLEKDGLKSPDLETNLRIAEHYMMLSNAVLGTNDYVLQHGLSLKAQQQYNVDLANKLVTLKDRNNDFIKTVILAPFDGIVVAVNLRNNDVLSLIDYASKGDIIIVDTSQLQFKGQVDEIDISKVQLGQNVTISVDAVPNQKFPGHVSFISPYGERDTNGVVRFNVTVLLDPTDVPLKGLLTSTAEIAVTSVQDVLVLPLTAINTAKDGSTSVTVITSDNKTEKMPVTLGLQNQVNAAVLTGLNEGDRVVIQESAAGAPTTRQNFGQGGGPPAGGGGPPGR